MAGQLGPIISGEIIVNGKNLTENPELLPKIVRYVDQNPNRAVIQTVSVIDFLSLCMLTKHPSPFRKALTAARTAKIRATLRDHGFSSDLLNKYSSVLSGGETQLVNVLGFLVENRSPALILLDEPLNGLDISNRARMKELLKLLQSTGAAIVVVSHESEDLDVNRVIDLENCNPQPTLTTSATSIAPRSGQ